jgi:hypothetical protein
MAAAGALLAGSHRHHALTDDVKKRRLGSSRPALFLCLA